MHLLLLLVLIELTQPQATAASNTTTSTNTTTTITQVTAATTTSNTTTSTNTTAITQAITITTISNTSTITNTTSTTKTTQNATYFHAGDNVFCGIAAIYHSPTDSPLDCQLWCSSNLHCLAYTTYEHKSSQDASDRRILTNNSTTNFSSTTITRTTMARSTNYTHTNTTATTNTTHLANNTSMYTTQTTRTNGTAMNIATPNVTSTTTDSTTATIANAMNTTNTTNTTNTQMTTIIANSTITNITATTPIFLDTTITMSTATTNISATTSTIIATTETKMTSSSTIFASTGSCSGCLAYTSNDCSVVHQLPTSCQNTIVTSYNKVLVFIGSLSFTSTALTREQVTSSTKKSLAQEFEVGEPQVTVSVEETRRLEAFADARRLAGTWNVAFSIAVPSGQAAAAESKAASLKSDPTTFNQAMKTNLQALGVSQTNATVQLSSFQATRQVTQTTTAAVPISSAPSTTAMTPISSAPSTTGTMPISLAPSTTPNSAAISPTPSNAVPTLATPTVAATPASTAATSVTTGDESSNVVFIIFPVIIGAFAIIASLAAVYCYCCRRRMHQFGEAADLKEVAVDVKADLKEVAVDLKDIVPHGQGSMCRNGCGRGVAPPKNGRTFDTCCRECAIGKGHSRVCEDLYSDVVGMSPVAHDVIPKGKGALNQSGEKGVGKGIPNGDSATGQDFVLATCDVPGMLGDGVDLKTLATPTALRLMPVQELDVTILPTQKWEDIKLERSFLDELAQNSGIRAALRDVDTLIKDVRDKLKEIPFRKGALDLIKDMDTSEKAAIVTYSHDFCSGVQAGNFYFELNNALRKRGAARAQMMATWGVCVRYILKALSKLPDHTGELFRGLPSRADIETNYQLGRPIQWGAFVSTSPDMEAAKQFCDRKNGVIIRIKGGLGKDIGALSFFPSEKEVILSPSTKFFVAEELCRSENGWYTIEIVQEKGNTYVF